MSNVAPDIAGVIEGWRAWELTELGLKSIYHEEYWPAGKELVARCPLDRRVSNGYDRSKLMLEIRAGAHRVPSPGCKCGIYAATSRNYGNIPMGTIYGKVALWGDVIRGTRASRASHAYPIELYARPPMMKHPALTKYGVPILPWSKLPWQLRLHKQMVYIFVAALLCLLAAVISAAVYTCVTGDPLPMAGLGFGIAAAIVFRSVK